MPTPALILHFVTGCTIMTGALCAVSAVPQQQGELQPTPDLNSAARDSESQKAARANLEIEKLRAEVAKLKAEATELEPGSPKRETEVDKLQAEIGKLNAETAAIELSAGPKLQAELAKLGAETRALPPWLGTALASIIGSVLSASIVLLGVYYTAKKSLETAFKSRVGEFDAKLYDARVTAYARLLKATEIFAVHSPEAPVDSGTCARAGKALRREYYGQAGMLMTDLTRKRFMALQHVVTRAANARDLRVPLNDSEYANWITEKYLDCFREHLHLTNKEDTGNEVEIAKLEMDRCASYPFDIEPPTVRPPGGLSKTLPSTEVAELFRDYVVLQFAASRLRTSINHELKSRRPLAELQKE